MMDALISFSDFVGFPLKCFKVFGLKPQDEDSENKVRRNILKGWRAIALACMTVPFMFNIVYVIQNSGNLILIADSLTASGFTLMAFVKVICIYRKKESFRMLLKSVEDSFPKTKLEQNQAPKFV
jgi:uncharacterized membrane protein